MIKELNFDEDKDFVVEEDYEDIADDYWNSSSYRRAQSIDLDSTIDDIDSFEDRRYVGDVSL